MAWWDKARMHTMVWMSLTQRNQFMQQEKALKSQQAMETKKKLRVTDAPAAMVFLPGVSHKPA
jgi:hypothetical protein